LVGRQVDELKSGKVVNEEVSRCWGWMRAGDMPAPFYGLGVGREIMVGDPWVQRSDLADSILGPTTPISPADGNSHSLSTET
jgi:hypothetical protein